MQKSDHLSEMRSQVFLKAFQFTLERSLTLKIVVGFNPTTKKAKNHAIHLVV
ncbi:MAG: hypothetical protein LBE38_10575 [Deltaproteobacteria bacterium]|nr:hypothetical protein [Deltaproteobacteria bacterium]